MLVATDIAARGIHVDDISLVVHIDPPAEHKAYLHRSGRTARAGASGVVVTVATREQRRDVADLMRKAAISPKHRDIRAGDPVIEAIVGPSAPRVRVVNPAPIPAERPDSGRGARDGTVAAEAVPGCGDASAGASAARGTTGGTGQGGARRSPVARGRQGAATPRGGVPPGRSPGSAKPRSTGSSSNRSGGRSGSGRCVHRLGHGVVQRWRLGADRSPAPGPASGHPARRRSDRRALTRLRRADFTPGRPPRPGSEEPVGRRWIRIRSSQPTSAPLPPA